MARKVVLLLLSLFLLTGLCCAAKGVMVDGQEIRRIGGWPAKSEEHVRANFHDDIEYVYLATIGDMMEALRQGKIDAIAMSRVFFNALCAEGEKGIAVLGDPIGQTNYAFVFAYSEHGDRLRGEFNAFLRTLKESGALDEMKGRWISGETPPVEPPNLSGENGTLAIATDGSCPPLIYLSDGKLGGFEAELLEADIPVRQIEEGRNVPMYITNIPCRPAGVFHGNTVVSMRPMTPSQAIRASIVTSAMPRVHGKPLHLGDPATIGIQDISKPDFGDAVTIRDGEIPVFWPCGVTPQAALMAAKPPFAITHAPGHMFITDVKNSALKY